MITFRVARETYGWAVQMGQHMTIPFRTREFAINEANLLAGSLRAHGQLAEVIVGHESSGLDAVPAHIASAAIKAMHQAR
jgi:hypothetical protein